jgi:hypothetical protein
MPNDLVRWGGSSRPLDTNDSARAVNENDKGTDPAEDWDLPPEEMGYGPRLTAGPIHDAPVRRAAAAAEGDAARARTHGDEAFAVLRETDAKDLHQSAWDWGDGRTWLWIAAMFFGFLLLVALCYFLPYGRHASPPPIRVY